MHTLSKQASISRATTAMSSCRMKIIMASPFTMQVEGLSNAVHNVTDALGLPPVRILSSQADTGLAMQVEGLSDAVHNMTDALGLPPVLSGPPPLSMPPPLGSMPPALAMPPGLSIPPGLSSAESDVMGFWDLYTNFGQTLASALSSLSNFIPNTFSISLSG